mgnify:FL=1|jgi:hypothetical protein
MKQNKNTLIINGEEFEVDGDQIFINQDSNGGRISVNGMPIKNLPEVKLVIEFKGDLASLTSYASTTVKGDVNGNIKTSNLNCGDVNGNIDAANVTCKNVQGDVKSNIMRCTEIKGNVDASVVKKG